MEPTDLLCNASIILLTLPEDFGTVYFGHIFKADFNEFAGFLHCLSHRHMKSCGASVKAAAGSRPVFYCMYAWFRRGGSRAQSSSAGTGNPPDSCTLYG